MEALLSLTTALGLVGSLALVAWGLALCAGHGFDVGAGTERG